MKQTKKLSDDYGKLIVGSRCRKDWYLEFVTPPTPHPLFMCHCVHVSLAVFKSVTFEHLTVLNSHYYS